MAGHQTTSTSDGPGSRRAQIFLHAVQRLLGPFVVVRRERLPSARGVRLESGRTPEDTSFDGLTDGLDDPGFDFHDLLTSSAFHHPSNVKLVVESVMGSSPQGRIDFGRAVGDELKRRYPFKTASNVAADVGCTIKAAENVLNGHLSAKSITRLVQVYGLGLLIDSGATVAGTTLKDFVIEQAASARREQEVARVRELEHEQTLAALENGLGPDAPRNSSGVWQTA